MDTSVSRGKGTVGRHAPSRRRDGRRRIPRDASWVGKSGGRGETRKVSTVCEPHKLRSR